MLNRLRYQCPRPDSNGRFSIVESYAPAHTGATLIDDLVAQPECNSGEDDCSGGAIRNEGWLTLIELTIAANASNGQGNGVLNTNTGDLRIYAGFIKDNVDYIGHGAAIYTDDAAVNIKSSVITQAAGYGGPSCLTNGSGAIAALGENLSTDASCPGFTLTNVGTPLVQSMVAGLPTPNFPTPTCDLLVGSPAIDTAADCWDIGNVNLVDLDQRAVTRPQAAACDLGAFEHL